MSSKSFFFTFYSDLRKGVEVSNLNKNDSVKASSDQEIVKESKGVGASSSKSPPVARQSWGRNTYSKEVTRGGSDKASHSKGDVHNDIEDEDAKSLSDEDDVINLEQLGRISGARIGKKSTNQDDEEEEEVSVLLFDVTHLGNLHCTSSCLISLIYHLRFISFLFICCISDTQRQQQ